MVDIVIFAAGWVLNLYYLNKDDDKVKRLFLGTIGLLIAAIGGWIAPIIYGF